MKELPISKIHNFAALKVERLKHQAYEQTNKIPEPINVVMPTALVGIEIEVENIKDYVGLLYYWHAKDDGSLRNYGVEYTSIPLRAYQVEYALDHLTHKMYANNNPEFSPRTSVHVHLNVRDMSWDQIKTLILLYAIFERHFFHIAGTKRETSVFCVPLYKTNQLNQLNLLEQNAGNWHKYSAINIGTILGNGDVPTFGTIEFRHLYGTMDKKVILSWINNILCLRQASVDISLEELKQKIYDMNTTSEYYALYKQVFGEFALTDLMSKKDFEYCVTTTKKVLWGKDYNTHLKVSLGSAYDLYYRKKLEQKFNKHEMETANKPLDTWDPLPVNTVEILEIEKLVKQGLNPFLNQVT